MAKPIFSSNIFGTDQEISWSATVYSTTNTVPIPGMVYRPATVTDTFGTGITFSTATRSQIDAHFNSNTVPGIVNSSGNEVLGRIPVIYDYWGSQAPLGVTRAGSTALRFRGFVNSPGTYGFAVMGRGTVKIFRNGSLILYGNFTEDSPAYTSALTTYSVNDDIEIYYWGLDQPWAGIGIRVFTDPAIVSSGDLDWELLRESDILSSSFMDSGDTLTTTSITDIQSVKITSRIGQTKFLDAVVASSGTSDIHGWSWDHTNKVLTNTFDNTSIKIGQLIKFSGGVQGDVSEGFTGTIIDIIPNDTSTVIKCASLEYRLAQTLSENYPDKMSYAVFGYTNRTGVSEPVWDVSAYDHWPYEHAIKDMLMRAWFDSSTLNASKQMLRVGETVAEDGQKLFKVRSLSGDHIRIQRQANYGNPNSNTGAAEDDPYLTASELTTSLYVRINNLLQRIGYEFKVDDSGNVVVRPRGNALSVTQVIGGTSVTHPSAVGGTYSRYIGTGWSYTSPAIKASRLDLVVGLGNGLGTLQIDITRAEDSWTDSMTINLDNSSNDVFYYDRRLDIDLQNIAAYSIVSGEDYATYTVTITPSGGTGSTEYRLDSIKVFEEDPINANINLSTLQNALSLKGQSNFTEQINDAIVTGVIKSTFSSNNEDISNEYTVSRATDIHSILNPSSDNYIGRKVTAFLSDESIADQDLADWVSRSLVSTYRSPTPDATVDHTIIPIIELRDALTITDSRWDAFDSTQTFWVVGYTHSYQPTSATTTLELTSFPETPSFEPVEEIDISLYNNKPIINMDISYPSLNGSSIISNPGNSLAKESTLDSTVTTVQNDGNFYLTVSAGTVSPGTELLYLPDMIDEAAFDPKAFMFKYLKNNPYHKFFEKSGTRLDLLFESGDGSSPYTPAGWGVTAGDAATYTYHRIQDVYSGTPPFYDPYYADLDIPELINISFDALVSGYYRVSVVDARSATPITVAWLTNPGQSNTDSESHWQYMTAGPNKVFSWDGTDNIGDWNFRQYEDYAERMRGNFDTTEAPSVGRGFLAGNDQTTGMTHISAEIESGKAVYPIGSYAQFYIKVETLRAIDNTPLIASSNVSSDMLDSSAAETSDRYIYYHLPQPNSVSVSIEDWDITALDYNPASPGSDWVSSPDDDASIRDGKPVRISLSANKRPGTKFSGIDSTKVRITRQVSLSVNIWDTTLIFAGQSWNSDSAGVEEKRLVNRRFTNDEHAVSFQDNFFSPGDELQPWTFYPSLFEKDFGRGEEPLAYMDYTQITEVPSWNPHRKVGEERSRHILSMMNYLFYLSVYSQDRSGRLVWAVDTSFIDKSKISQNSNSSEFPEDLTRHQRRAVYTRQWWDYDELSNQLSTYSVPNRYFGGYSDRFDYFSEGTGDALYPLGDGTYYNNNPETIYQDKYSIVIRNNNQLVGLAGDTFATARLNRDLGDASNTVLGTWTWESSDGILWVPNITRDFHPFYIVPPMALPSYLNSDGETWYEGNYWPVITDESSSGKGDQALYDSFLTILPDYDSSAADFNRYELKPGRPVADIFKEDFVPSNIVQYQRQDDTKHYENCRGGWSNGARGGRDLINVIGGDPYFQNVKLYRYFRFEPQPFGEVKKYIYKNDVYRWFHMTFRHQYNWESASMFPVDDFKALVPGAIDADITGSPVRPSFYDLGAWAGWKDDHPSAQQEGQWVETGTSSELHWRNDFTNLFGSLGMLFLESHAGGSNSIDNPTVALPGEDLKRTYLPNQNIFLQKAAFLNVFDGNTFFNYMPLAVGPRLPETRRVLMGLALVNSRRNTEV